MSLGTVTVEIGALKGKLRENRNKHETEWVNGYDGWVKYVETTLGEYARLFAIEMDAVEIGSSERDLKVPRFDSPPKNHLDDYDRVISMLDWSVDETVELSQVEFEQYVQDNWAWKREFALKNASYTQ